MNDPTRILTSIFLTSFMGLASCTSPGVLSETNPTSQAIVQQTQAQANPNADRADDCILVESGFGPQGNVSVRVEEVASGLDVPWGIGFLPDGNILVTERTGQVRLVQNGQVRSQPVATINVTARGEGGLLGLAMHPDFVSNRFFYIYYTADTNTSSVNRVERWRLSADGLSASRDRIIVDNIPVSQFHNGGRLRFGPDGMLYIGTGDARNPDLSQDINSLAGKILRVTPEGQVPSDNPFPNNPVYILGIRNTQGFDWVNPSTMQITDHGPTGELGRSGHDEISVATAGDNLGWPTIYRCESQEGLVTPSIVWERALPPGGATIYTGNAIPEWRGNLIVATLRSENLHRVIFDPQSPQQVERHEVYLQGEYGRLREAIMGPDGELYVTTSNCDGRGNCPADRDKILRITR